MLGPESNPRHPTVTWHTALSLNITIVLYCIQHFKRPFHVGYSTVPKYNERLYEVLMCKRSLQFDTTMSRNIKIVCILIFNPNGDYISGQLCAEI